MPPLTACFTELPALLREAATLHLLPRWQRLQAGEVEEKSPGELVTVVDRELEAWLTPRLQALRPEARVVGEEACAAEPGLLQHLDEGEVWLIDPLDGTRNFIEGRPSIAVMVALLRCGEPVAGWMLNPITDVLHAAESGGGAWRDGQRVRSDHHRPGPRLRGVVKTHFLPPGVKETVLHNAQGLAEQLPGTNCAGEDYPLLLAGRTDCVLYWRTLPWDHAAGTLLLQEAGGVARRPDGTRYEVATSQPGLLVAPSPAAWQAAQALLFAP